ncbi:MAG: hypothetical protein JW741_24975 [Sedimentisphaerales bacterium]|nr:hypothetical protein [Sedimentisphaerales bacterium]
MRTGIIVATVLAMATGAWAADAGRKQADRVLNLVPAESLFCVRINNLDGALSGATDFLTGIAPEGFNAGTMVTAKLGSMVGQDRMEQVRRRGNFTMFGVMLPDGEGNQNPFANLFTGMLVPVKDYDAFVGGDAPAGRGIAAVSVDGQPRAIAMRLGRYALLSQPGADDKLKRARRMLQGGKASLGSALKPQDKELAAAAPIWLYANVEKASAIVKPMVFGKLEQIKAGLKKASEQEDMPIANPEGIIRFYAGLLDMITSETAWVSVGLTPSSQACHATFTMKTLPGTKLAGTMGAVPHASAYKRALGNLHDDAVINFAAAMDGEAWEKSYQLFIDLMPKMIEAEVSEAEMADLRKLVSKSFGAMGESLSFSFVPAGEGPGMFSMQYVFEVEDGAAMEDAIREGLQVANSKMYREFMANFGMQVRAVVESETTTYRDVRINSARLTFEADDEDSPPAQMLQAMWGGGFDYRWGVTDGHCVYVIGKDADKHTRRLIDQVKAGGAKGVCPEMQAALASIPNSDKADAVGTFNYVRMLNATLSAMPLPGGKKLAPLNAPTEGNVAFAAFSADDGFTIDLVLPRKHIMEIQSALQNFGEQVKEMEKQ